MSCLLFACLLIATPNWPSSPVTSNGSQDFTMVTADVSRALVKECSCNNFNMNRCSSPLLDCWKQNKCRLIVIRNEASKTVLRL